jgi:hypothetical protein
MVQRSLRKYSKAKDSKANKPKNSNKDSNKDSKDKEDRDNSKDKDCNRAMTGKERPTGAI